MSDKNTENFHLKSGYVPLKEYTDARFDALSRAVDKAENTLADRLAGMNEFRNQLKDQASKFVTRDELTLTIKPLCDDIRELRDFMRRQEGKASQNSVLMATAIAVAGLLVSLVKLLLK